MIKSLKKKQGGFTLIELMVVIVIIGILVAIALPNFIGAQDRAKISSVKANMHTFQTMVETYAVDVGGVYPSAITNLHNAATNSDVTSAYWKAFKNPFTNLGPDGMANCDVAGRQSCQDVSAFTSAGVGTIAAGNVGYIPGRTQGAAATDPYTTYAIYGGGKAADQPIKDSAGTRPFELSNS